MQKQLGFTELVFEINRIKCKFAAIYYEISMYTFRVVSKYSKNLPPVAQC